MRPLVFAVLLGLAGGTAVAAPKKAESPATEKMSTLMVFGNDPCPKSSSADEIVVCARLPESERYRIPKKLRDQRHTDVASQAWANRVEEIDWVSRDGLPNSCSTNGSGGQTGCYQKFMRQWRAERQLMARERSEAP